MTGVQKFFKAILPRRMAEEMETESRAWEMQCECGRSTSIWELGGIRWKAKGSPRRLMKCQGCGETKWHTVERRDTATNETQRD